MLEKGIKIEGYELILEEKLNDINSLGLIYKHKKTGAKVAVVSNEDIKKTFSIVFKTPTENDKGVAHILEHSVLCGSKKYNCKDPFVELQKGSLNLSLNAATGIDNTFYPIVTYNDKEFHNIMDVYLDAVFYPNIYINDNIFKREGWHYELNSEDDDIKVNGIVYNEMKGNYSKFVYYLNKAIDKSLFKNDIYSNNSGGDPEYIIDLTYEEFLEFHSKYYHPSNCHIYMYGNMNFKEELEFIDKEYLSNFEYKEINLGSFGTREIGEYKDVEYYYPISKNEDENNKTILSYNFNIGGDILLDIKKNMALSMLIYTITDVSSSLIKDLNKNGFYTIYLHISSHDISPIFSIVNLNSNIEDKNKFISTIQNSLKKIVDEGIDKELLLSIIKHYEFYYKEADSNDQGYLYLQSIKSNWLYSDYDPFMSLHIDEVFTFLKDMVNTNYYEEFVKEYLVDNPITTLVTLIGDKNMLDNKDARINKKIKEYKDSLSKEDINKLIEDTKNLKKYQDYIPTQEELSIIPRVTLKDIDKKAQKIEYKKKDINDTTVIYRHLPVNDIIYFDILFNVDNVPKTLIQYMGLYVSILRYFDTDKYTAKELNEKIMSESAGIDCALSQYKKDEKITLTISSKAFICNLHNIMDIIINMIYNTKYNKERLLYKLHDIISSLELTDHMNIATFNANSHTNTLGVVTELLNGRSYYNFISDLINNYDEKYDTIIEMFNRINEMIFSKENILINISYNISNQNIVEDIIKDFINNINEKSKYNTNIFNGFDIMDETEFATADKFKVIKSNDAFITADNVQYITLASDYTYDEKYSGYLYILNTLLYKDYLFNNLRTKGGAYGAYSTFNQKRGLITLNSFRDPNLRKTIDIFNSIVDYVRNFDATREEMEKYIIGTINKFDKPESNSTKNESNILQYLFNETDENRQLIRDQILNATPEDIRNLADLIQSIIDNSSICVVGSEEQINNNKDLFDNIYKI